MIVKNAACKKAKAVIGELLVSSFETYPKAELLVNCDSALKHIL